MSLHNFALVKDYYCRTEQTRAGIANNRGPRSHELTLSRVNFRLLGQSRSILCCARAYLFTIKDSLRRWEHPQQLWERPASAPSPRQATRACFSLAWK